MELNELIYVGVKLVCDKIGVSLKNMNRNSKLCRETRQEIQVRNLRQAAVVSILLYGCTSWTLTKRTEEKIDGNYTRMLRAILNESWRQRHTKHQLYGHRPPITNTTQIRRTRHVRHCWKCGEELINDILLCTPNAVRTTNTNRGDKLKGSCGRRKTKTRFDRIKHYRYVRSFQINERKFYQSRRHTY